MKLDYIVTGTPKPQSRPRFFRNKAGYMGTFSPKTDWFNIVYAETLKIKQEYLSNKKLDRALSIELNFFMPIPKSLSNKKKMLLGNTYVKKKPDIDNLAKAVLDAINYTNLWEDDSQIVDLRAIKTYSDEPSCRIIITEVE